MQNGDWEALFEHNASSDSWYVFKEIMLKHEETCTIVPYIQRMNTKNRYWAKYRRTNSREQYDKFKTARNRLRKIKRNSIKKT